MNGDPMHEVDILRDRLQAGDRAGSDVDRDALLELSDNMHLIPSNVGGYRHRDILRRSTIMSERVDDVDLVDVLEDKDAAEAVVRWINRTHDNEFTNQDYRKDLRAFGRHYLQLDEPPETLAWIPTGTSNNYDPVPSERDLLDYEQHVKPMADQCRNTRDACLIMLQFEAGLRGGELYDLRVGDIFDSEHSIGLHVDGKEGERSVHLIESTPYLQRWLTNHPASDDAEAPLWSKLSTPERMSYPTFLNYFHQAADRAGVSKKPTPTNFRKSNTRWLVRLGFSQPEIEDRQGRVRGSDHTAHYMARFGSDSLEKSYASLHGKDVGMDEEVANPPVPCPRCHEETPAELDFCMHCNQALDLESKQLLDQVSDAFDEKAIKSDDVEERERLLSARRTMNRQPNMMGRDQLHEFVSSLSASED